MPDLLANKILAFRATIYLAVDCALPCFALFIGDPAARPATIAMNILRGVIEYPPRPIDKLLSNGGIFRPRGA